MTDSIVNVFLSHNLADKEFTRRLARDLSAFGVEVWLDEDEIRIGESLVQEIGEGIDEADYVVVVLSPDSVVSRWVKEELDIAMNQQIADGKLKVLPLLYRQCELPRFLVGKLYADFTSEEKYAPSFDRLLKSMGIDPTSSELEKAEDKVFGGMIVATIDKKPIRWKVPAALTWTIDEQSFDGCPDELQLANQICSQATEDWNAAAKRQNIDDLIHFENNASNPVFKFTYSPQIHNGIFVVAFFPSDSVDKRVVHLCPDLFSNNHNIDPTGAVRHNLGHVLGFRHEHIHPDAGEQSKFGEALELGEFGGMALGKYNPDSVMHYPEGDIKLAEMRITKSDEAGLQMLYTIPRGMVFEFPV